MALHYNLIVAQEEAKVMLTLRKFAMISSDVHYECQAKCIEQLVLLVNIMKLKGVAEQALAFCRRQFAWLSIIICRSAFIHGSCEAQFM